MPVPHNGYIEYPGEVYPHKSSRLPGGKFPEGWEFFKPAYGILWFVRPLGGRSTDGGSKMSNSGGKESVTYKILGLCPIKCPLDPCFDKLREDLAVKNSISNENSGSDQCVASNQISQCVAANQIARRNSTESITHSTESITHSTESISHISNNKQLDTSDELKVKERERKSEARYFSSWNPLEIPQLLENVWIQKEVIENEHDKDDHNIIRTPPPPCRRRRRPVVDIVAVINLCATDRYYNKNSFLKKGQAFSYLRVEGGNRVPSREDISKLEAVWDELFDEFGITEESSDIDELLLNRWGYQWPIVLIHCTHGVNRTGYCTNYLMLKHSKELTVKESLDLFHRARGHGINKDELCRRLYEQFEPDQNSNQPAIRRGSGLIILG